ncbi:hypothetical protein DRN98_06150 [Methanosarcinales archaeon]|nr:MAG: hypothetical protein DRN98_06150 [Methanosarcinales archaeon]
MNNNTLAVVLSNYELKYSDISVFLDKEERSYYVYLGIALLERVSINEEELGYKIFIGRLYNSGVSLKKLKERFRHDHRTIKKWGEALKSGDIGIIEKAFSGRKGNVKAKLEVVNYIRHHRERYLLGKKYREVIVKEVEEIFGIKISKRLVSEICKKQFLKGRDGDFLGKGREKRSIIASFEGRMRGNFSGMLQRSPFFMLRSRKFLIHHGGQILFEGYMSNYIGYERQLLIQLLQGHVNIEQSKGLCFRSIGIFIDRAVRVLREQREQIAREGTKDNIHRLYMKNKELLRDGPDKGKIFYFDPHTKHYTGQLKILKGWCGSLHRASKVLNLDCFHTISGRVCFIKHYSAYYDLRERFFISLREFDMLFKEDNRHGRTFIIDRAIYSEACLNNFDKDYLITWEKGYRGDGWDKKKRVISFEREKSKNSKRGKVRRYRFSCQVSKWKKNEKFRRIIVKAKNDNEKEIEVSILCSDPEITIQDAVWLMFNRWLQENDFKYLIKHFGIDQLDSYAWDNFEERAFEFRDKKVVSEEYKKLKRSSNKLIKNISKKLYKLKQKKKKLKQLETEKLSIEGALRLPETNKSGELRRAIAGVKRQIKTLNNSIDKLNKEILELEKQHEIIEEKQVNMLSETSKIQYLIDNSYVLLNVKRKAYIDAIRVNAANIFRNLNDIFRPIYDNFRDDHHYLRILTRAPAIVSSSDSFVHFMLWIPGTLQNYIIEALKQFIDIITQQINSMNPYKELKITLNRGPLFL